MDAVTAYLVALVAAAVVLLLFGVIGPGMSMDEVVGKLVLQASAGSFGAILATSTLSGGEDEGAGSGEDADGAEAGERGGSGEADGSGDEPERRLGYGAELLLMCAGALFLALNIAPTEEIAQIAARMGPWLVLVLMTVSIAAMHAFVYAVEFRGQEAIPAGTPMWSIVLRFTVVGYALSLLIAAYVLWCFGRLDGLGPTSMAMRVAVLAFPAAIGAASARLVL
jgi:putative integral membrane protein (TIGR02587 family)